MFWLLTIVMVLIACGFVCWPLIYRQRSHAENLSRKQVNIALFKEHVAELEAALALNELSAIDYTQQKYELENTLLEDAVDTTSYVTTHRGKHGLRWFVLWVPLMAFTLYRILGSHADVTLMQALSRMEKAPTQVERQEAMQDVLILLEIKARKQPQNTDNLFLLGQFYLQQNQYQKAADTFAQSLGANANDADVLAQYSQALFFAAGNKLTFAVTSTAEQAIKINPQQPTALGMLGISAFENKKYRQAIQYWQQVLTVVGEQDTGAVAVKAGIARAIELLKQQGEWPFITVRVDIDKKLLDADNPAQRIFVYARKVGERKPLAVTVVDVKSLPQAVTLDDSNAMPGGELLSSATQVDVVARLSQSGSAFEGKDDKQAITTVSFTSKAKPTVNLFIK